VRFAEAAVVQRQGVPMTVGHRLAVAALSAAFGLLATWAVYRSVALDPAPPLITRRSLLPQPSAGGPPSTLWLLSVGVSNYTTPELRLGFAHVDARAIAEAADRAALGGNFEEVRTLLLTDERVTRESMLNAMADFLGQAEPNDVVMLFLAGHGVRDLRSDGFYFLPQPANPENLLTEGLRMADFDEMLRNLRRNVRAVVVMLDTCHAGALGIPSDRLVPAYELPGQISSGEGFFLIAASRPGEQSKELPSLGHGAFTFALLEAFGGAADANQDGELTVSELFGYVARRVPELTADTQHPYHKIEGTDLALFGAPAEVVLAVPTPSFLDVVHPAGGNNGEAANTIGVMEFENLRSDPEFEWMRNAIRVAFNTELSKVQALRVYSPELIDRTARKRGADPLSTARDLGIGRLVTGSYHVTGRTLRIDARLVHAASGMNEASDSVEGDLDDFFGLQKRLVLSMLRRLRVRVSPEEGESIQTETNTDVDAYRLLLEAEGLSEPSPTSEQTRTAPTLGPQSRRGSGVALARLAALLDLAGEAAAAEEEPAAEIASFLESYRQALENKDVEHVAALYASFSERQRAALAAYFATANDLGVTLTNVKAAAHEGGVAVTFTRKDEFTDAKSNRPVQLEVRLTKILVKQGGQWKIGGKK
jgi:uncharacterized caspase-like protein/TolB-like protein/ketosteroid isomerase-like protein